MKTELTKIGADGKADKDVRAPLRPRSKREYIQQLVVAKRRWHHELTDEEKEEGYKGWHTRGYLPHFDSPGLTQFVTFRLFDSVPQTLRRRWLEIMELEDDREKFRQIERQLDRGDGACYLNDKRIAEIVENTLLFYNEQDYRLLAWVLMPNHVHVLVENWKPLPTILRNLKSFSATRANSLLGRSGQRFWQPDYFDRYVRNQEQFEKVVRYIENNPVKAGLVGVAAEWKWSSARFRGRFGASEPLNVAGHTAVEKNADKDVRAPIK